MKTKLLLLTALAAGLTGCMTMEEKITQDVTTRLEAKVLKARKQADELPIDKVKRQTFSCMMGLVDREIEVDKAEKACSNIYRRQK
jgi:hypothetical protein